MKKILFFAMVITALMMTSISVGAMEDYIVAQDDFSSDSINSDMWNKNVNYGEFGDNTIKVDPENTGNKCLAVEVLQPANGVVLSETVMKNNYGTYFTAEFKMKLYTGDNNQLTEYAGCYIQYKNDDDFLALQWSRRFDGDNPKIALVKNGYERDVAVVMNSASGFQEDWDPYEWTTFKIVCAGSRVLVYVNDAQEPCIRYDENTHTDGKLGFFNRGMYANNSCLYVDDVVIRNEAGVVSDAGVICGNEKFTCVGETVINSRFADAVEIDFAHTMKAAEIKFVDEDKNDVPYEFKLDEAKLTIIPKAKLGNGKKYYIDFESLTTIDDNILLSVPSINFTSAKNAINVVASLLGQDISFEVERNGIVTGAYIYVAHYKDNILVDLIPVTLPNTGNPMAVTLLKTIDENSDIKIYSFDGTKFEKIIADPVSCIN